MSSIIIDASQLSELLFKASQNGATRALELAGVLKKTITYAEVRKKYGPAIADAARFAPGINWIPMGKAGKTSGTYCNREEFEKFIFSREFEFNRR